jgi:thioredoxin 1
LNVKSSIQKNIHERIWRLTFLKDNSIGIRYSFFRNIIIAFTIKVFQPMSLEDEQNDEEILEIKQRKLREMQKMATMRSTMNSITKPIVLTDLNFKEEISKYPVMLIDFWAPWCGPCRLVSPIIEQLASEYAGRVVFGKLNIDENQMIPQSFGIQSIPTMMILKNSRVVDILVGALSKAQIETKLRQHSSDSKSATGGTYN